MAEQVSKMAEVLGVELTAETIAAQLGISDPDLGPATGGARLDALELRLITKRCLPPPCAHTMLPRRVLYYMRAPHGASPPTGLRLRVAERSLCGAL